jgi:ADP-heptose:LPS heptosyltransferase
MNCDTGTTARAPYVLVFIGGNIRSKRWPAARWIEFIHLFRRYYSCPVILAGASGPELAMAREIQQRTDAQSIAGQASLPELLAWVSRAEAVLSNDTMAAHMSALCRRPTVIIANGVNYYRFTEYARLGLENVATVYPDLFIRRRSRLGAASYDYIDAISSDIESIQASVVLDRLESVLGGGTSKPAISAHSPSDESPARNRLGSPG